MKIHKLEDGDIIKILPMVMTNNEIIWIKEITFTHIDKKIIYDSKGYLRKISKHVWGNGGQTDRFPVSTRYFMNILIDGEIRVLNVGRTLYTLICNNPQVCNLSLDYHLNIVKEEKQGFPIFDKSSVIKHQWSQPVSDINSEEEWLSYIKSNQPDFDTHIEKNNIFNHKQLLIDHLGKDLLGELISEDRQKKLEGLGV
jgi:hypothetical protein